MLRFLLEHKQLVYGHLKGMCKDTLESERLPDKVNDCLELNDYSGKKGPKRAPKAKNAATEKDP